MLSRDWHIEAHTGHTFRAEWRDMAQLCHKMTIDTREIVWYLFPLCQKDNGFVIFFTIKQLINPSRMLKFQRTQNQYRNLPKGSKKFWHRSCDLQKQNDNSREYRDIKIGKIIRRKKNA